MGLGTSNPSLWKPTRMALANGDKSASTLRFTPIQAILNSFKSLTAISIDQPVVSQHKFVQIDHVDGLRKT